MVYYLATTSYKSWQSIFVPLTVENSNFLIWEILLFRHKKGAIQKREAAKDSNHFSGNGTSFHSNMQSGREIRQVLLMYYTSSSIAAYTFFQNEFAISDACQPFNDPYVKVAEVTVVTRKLGRVYRSFFRPGDAFINVTMDMWPKIKECYRDIARSEGETAEFFSQSSVYGTLIRESLWQAFKRGKYSA